VTLDEAMVEALKRDYTTAPISEQDRAMLDYVVKLTKDATKCSPADHEKLRAVGFDDKGSLTTSIASPMRWVSGAMNFWGLREENCSHRFFFSAFHFFEHFVSSDSNGKRPRGVSRRDGGGWD
jgi:hypothetical protein